MKKEFWKPFTYKGYNTQYLVGSNGHIIDLSRNKELRTEIMYNGYVSVDLKLYDQENLSDKPKKYSTFLHRIVALTFVYNDDPENKTQVDHLDGNKENNQANNLEWVTPKENIRRAYEKGLHGIYKGSKSPHHKLTEEIAIKIAILLRDHSKDMTMIEMANFLGVKKHDIETIKYRRAWKDIAEKYNIPKKTFKARLHPNKYYDLLSGLFKKGYTNLYIINNFYDEKLSRKDFRTIVYTCRSKYERENPNSISNH